MSKSTGRTTRTRRRAWLPFARGLLVALVVIAALGLAPRGSARAQQPTATPTPPPTTTGDKPLRLSTLVELGLADLRMNGSRATRDFFFLGAGDFELGNNSRVILVISHSNLLTPEDSTVNIVLNSRAIRTIRLDNSNVEQTRYEIQVPRDAIARGFNKLTFEFAMRIEQAACADPAHPALYATLHSGTGFLIDFATEPPVPKLDPPDLAAYPYPFFNSGFPIVAPVDIVVPDDANRAELTGAYRLAANLAARVLFDLKLLQLKRVSELSDDDRSKHQLIAIGAVARNPLVAPVLAKTSVQSTPGGLTRNGAAVAPEIGVLAVQPSPWNATFRALVVTGATDDAVTRGIDVLVNPEPTALLAGPEALLTEPVAKLTSGQLSQIFTFTDTGSGEVTLSGSDSAQTQNIGFSAAAPAPDSNGELDLIVSTPETLDRGRSNVIVELNGRNINTIVLSQTQPRRASYRVKLPADAFRVGPNTLTLRETVYAPPIAVAGPCVGGAPERAWVTFHGDSAIKLPAPAATGEGVTLASLPFPFAGLEGMRDTVVIVDPAHPASVRSGMLVTIALGRRFRARNEFDVLPAGAATRESIGDKNIVAIAVPDGSTIDQELSKVLPLILRPDGTRALVQEQGGVLTQILASSRLGAVQEAQVPWAPTRRVLSINGTDDTALGWVADALTKRGLAANVALFQGADQVNTFSLQRISDEALQKKLQERFKPEEARGRTIISFLLIAGGGALMLGLWGARGRVRPGMQR